MTPANHFINWQQDPHGNWLARFVFPEPARELKIEVDLVAELAVVNPFDFFVEAYAETLPFAYPDELKHELAALSRAGATAGAALDAFVAAIAARARRRSSISSSASTSASSSDIGYMVRMEPGVQTPDETLALRSGSCRDTAWLLVQVLRRLGLAARFVSGYLIQLKHDIEGAGRPAPAPTTTSPTCTPGPRSIIPGAGWIGLRPDLRPALRRGPHAARGHAALPLRRADHRHGRACAEVDFDFDMERRPASPNRRASPCPSRTKPGTRSTRSASGSTRDLAAQDVRLTMGGEPTFVSIDDYRGARSGTRPPSARPSARSPTT